MVSGIRDFQQERRFVSVINMGRLRSTAPVVAPRSVRVNIMLPEDVLQAIDKVSGNRSRFLADAARAKLVAA